MKRILIIDGNSMLYRAFYGVPELKTAKGVHTNAIYGFLNLILRLTEEYSPNKIIAAFDLHAPSFRHKLYSEYKAGRQKPPEALTEQMEIAQRILPEFGIDVVTCPEHEADDILGTLSYEAGIQNIFSFIVTGDKDSLQLISDYTSVILNTKGISHSTEYNEAVFKEDFKLLPSQFVDFKALMGDPSDNIPGAPGVGPKTAIALLQKYNSLDNIYQNIDSLTPASAKNSLINNKDTVLMSQHLCTIVKNAPVSLPEISDSKYIMPLNASTESILKEYELNRILKKISANSSDEVKNDVPNYEKNFINIDQMSGAELINSLSSASQISVFNEGTEKLVTYGCVLWTEKGDIYTTKMQFRQLCAILHPILEDEQKQKFLQNIKQTLHICKSLGIEIKNAAFDYSIAHYLLDSTAKRNDIDSLACTYLSNEWMKNAQCLSTLKETMENKLKEQNMLSLYKDIEMPLINVLFEMEDEGIKVDTSLLSVLNTEYEDRLSELTDQIIDMAGETFNINSSKQLSDILFKKLGLKAAKKTATGYSTDIEVLEQLRNEHPIINLIIEYRQLSKLKSTYTEGLLAAADSERRVHTTFNQTVANTGRLSSTAPNLQNIPVRTDIGKKIRTAFVADNDESVLLDADYSQIELRVFAHMSNDPSFINAFMNNDDIHRRTASEVFFLSYDDVTEELRTQAKAVNFGIIYGISDFGLSKNLGIPRAAAKQIISNYYKRYPSILQYMQNSITFAKENRYCLTLFGRRKDCSDLNSRNFSVKSFTERTAINMPVQGTAADIIKIAMIKVYDALKEGGFRSKILLQVHDELVLNVYKDEYDKVYEIVKNCMENVITLSVPLLVDIGNGKSWGDAK